MEYESIDGVAAGSLDASVAPTTSDGYVDVETPSKLMVEVATPALLPGIAESGMSVVPEAS